MRYRANIVELSTKSYKEAPDKEFRDIQACFLKSKLKTTDHMVKEVQVSTEIHASPLLVCQI